MKIGLYFGSFNPIHIGHLIIADTLQDRTDLDQIWFVVSPQNPLKKRQSLIHEFDRLRMVELAIEDNYQFKASDVEFSMPKPSYTIDTLAYLTDQYPQHQFCLFLGSDNLTQLKRWKNYQTILDNYEIFVYPRPGDATTSEHPNIKLIDAPLLDISATFIRKSILAGKSVKYLLPDGVADYIRDKKLYL
ncbi:nicotinate-nucleotide adenylyltransferase [Algoriphagus ratkowskyi]|uniref:Probable nicotinate-nucleotide adenylyltransferase n=1 Tax=Algoriphagus ratkowskyi TaxID=57028 RepID=A0A2W7RYH9_9BACT|nr:nicotinate (nicotinamide) nucleotide adenylyltransferase [Algoriphagus ratkowskyi]PZX60277.1 nicotinate-nucleotide adenylyltransferase [Algoriphagus ratkowskyi]TXD78095.1 nicotinate-nucleotide adenylyltransferase [Algoriphagus ratkowskyi]